MYMYGSTSTSPMVLTSHVHFEYGKICTLLTCGLEPHDVSDLVTINSVLEKMKQIILQHRYIVYVHK